MNKQSNLSRLNSAATIGQIVSADEEAGELLSSIGLNVEKHEGRSLRSVCKDRKWSETEVLKWIKNKCQPTNGRSTSDFGNDLVQWSEYLQEKYHAANIERLQEIGNAFPRVHKIHGNQYTWLKNMQWQFDRLEEAITMYYKFEEKKFFPLLKKFEEATNELAYGTIDKLERGVEIIRKDQKRLLNFMKKLRLDSNEFENPPNACSTLRILNQNFKMLFDEVDKQFEIEQNQILPVLEEKIEAAYL